MTVLANARIVTRTEVIEGAVVIEGETIAAVEPGRAAGDVDFAGDYLLPGLVDLHTDALEKHYIPRPGVQWNPAAAAMAHDAQMATSGITTVFDSLAFGTSFRRPERKAALAPLLQGLQEAADAGALRCDHFLHARCEVTDPETIPVLKPYLDDPRLRFMSLMNHAPGQRQSPDIEVYRQRHMADMNMSAEEMDKHVAELLWRAAELAPQIRTDLVEIGHGLGIPMASHDDETPEHVAEAASEGQVLSEFPTTMAAAFASHELGLVNLMGGPNAVRGGSNYGNISARMLAEEGLLDVLASDYVPASLMHAVFVLGGEAGLTDLATSTGWASIKAAEAAGLSDRGAIEAGLRADLVRVQVASGVPVVRETDVAGQRVA